MYITRRILFERERLNTRSSIEGAGLRDREELISSRFVLDLIDSTRSIADFTVNYGTIGERVNDPLLRGDCKSKDKNEDSI